MIIAMNHITLAVIDIDRSFSFYYKILGLKPLVKWDKGAYFLVGDENPEIRGSAFWLCLNVDAAHSPTPGYTHYAFSVTKENFQEMSKKIISSGVHVFKENTSPGDSLYFLDPDGHKLEIHTGNYEERIKAKKGNIGNWKEVEWF